MTTLLLIRHGQTPNNVIGALDTALPGAGLTDLGHRQAADLVARLDGERIDRLVASEHERARLTALPLAEARGLEMRRDAGFGEIEAGDVEMATSHEAAGVYLDTSYAWANGDLDVRMPGAATGHETFERFDAALSRALDGLADDATLAVISHGALLRMWVTARAGGITPDDVRGRRLLNTTVLEVEGSPGAWRFVGWHEPRIVDADADDPTSQADEE